MPAPAPASPLVEDPPALENVAEPHQQMENVAPQPPVQVTLADVSISDVGAQSRFDRVSDKRCLVGLAATFDQNVKLRKETKNFSQFCAGLRNTQLTTILFVMLMRERFYTA